MNQALLALTPTRRTPWAPVGTGRHVHENPPQSTVIRGHQGEAEAPPDPSTPNAPHLLRTARCRPDREPPQREPSHGRALSRLDCRQEAPSAGQPESQRSWGFRGNHTTRQPTSHNPPQTSHAKQSLGCQVKKDRGEGPSRRLPRDQLERASLSHRLRSRLPPHVKRPPPSSGPPGKIQSGPNPSNVLLMGEPQSDRPKTAQFPAQISRRAPKTAPFQSQPEP